MPKNSIKLEALATIIVAALLHNIVADAQAQAPPGTGGGQPGAPTGGLGTGGQGNVGVGGGLGNSFGGGGGGGLGASTSAAGTFGGGSQNSLFGNSGQAILSAVGFSNLFSQGQTPGAGQSARGGGLTGGGLGGMGRGGAMGGVQNARNVTARSQVTYRTKLNVGFSVPRVATPRISTRLTNNLKSLPVESVGSPLSVTLNGDNSSNGQLAILRGTVATDELRQVAERLALLEPGISAVRNEIQIRPTAGSSSPLDVNATPPPQVESLR